MNKFIKDSIKFAGLIIILNTIFNSSYLLYIHGLNVLVFGGIVAITGGGYTWFSSFISFI